MFNISKRKKRYILSYVFLFVAFILQTTLIQNLKIFNVAPSLLLVTVVCFSLINDIVPSAVFAVVAGFLLDISAGRVIGLNALLMMYLSFAVVVAGQDLFRETSRSAAFLIMICTVIFETVFAFFNFAIFSKPSVWYTILRVVLVEAVYNGIVAIPIYLLFCRFLRIRTGHSLFD